MMKVLIHPGILVTKDRKPGKNVVVVMKDGKNDKYRL